MVETAEKVEKSSVKEAPHAAANLTVSNQEMAASRTPTEVRANVVNPDGKLNFSNIYGPEGVNPELATPLKAVKPGDPVQTGDGRVVAPVTDNAGHPTDNPASVSNDAGVIKSRQDLAKLTDGMTPDQKREVQADMTAIENRKPPLSADQVKSIYDSTAKLLRNEGDRSPLSADERNQLAGSILHNASLRTGTDQGFHNTCNVTTLERRLNVTNPAEAARIVSEVGLTGEFKSKDGQVIKLDQASLHEDAESRLQFGDKATDGKRNYASQLFDMAEINNYWQHQKPPLFYSQVAPTGQSDTGERLTYANGTEVKGPDGKPMRQPALSTDAMAEIGKDLGFTGKFIISNADVAGPGQSDGTSKVRNYQEFTDALTNGQPPAIIMVNSNDRLFGGNGDKGGSGGWHVVNVSDYKAGPPAQVFMTNQWGSANNKWVNVSDLYNATLPTNSGRVGADGQGGDQGGQQGGGDQGGQQGGGDQGGTRRGWSRNDGVMRDEDFRSWKKAIEQEDPNKDPNKDQSKKPQQHLLELIQPLQNQLETAINNHDDAQAGILRAKIESLRGTSGN
ncbi:MAG: hypothetical protein JST89_02155 [Cyanobacteria bacterium SZAS-4]|nr:hypothetical protein [Cyanobacteria bacterium SZAS-4]